MRFARSTRTACGTESRHERAAPHHASTSTTVVLVSPHVRWNEAMPPAFPRDSPELPGHKQLGQAAVDIERLTRGGEQLGGLAEPPPSAVPIAFRKR
jgi:hypothetical protein